MSRGPLRRATVATFVTLLLLAPLASSIAFDVPDVKVEAAPPAVPLDTFGDTPVPLRLDVTGILDEDDLVGPSPTHTPVPADGTGMGPGSLLHISMNGGAYICTANFIWQDSAGKKYLGSAGHCFLPPGKTATHGPGADWSVTQTTVRVCVDACSIGSNIPDLRHGTWVSLGNPAYARQTGPGGDLGNDFGVIEIPTSAHSWIRPSMPVFGGPTTVGTATLGKLLCHHGHGAVYGESVPTLGRLGSAWTQSSTGFTAILASAGGDSGSAVQTCAQDASGIHGVAAIGILTHAQSVPALIPVVGSYAPLATGFTYGTSIPRAQAMATQAGLTISPVLVA